MSSAEDLAAGVTPADIAAIYDFPPTLDGTGETIGVLNAGGAPLTAVLRDVTSFWTRFGVAPLDVRAVTVGERRLAPVDPIAAFDLTAGLAWMGALAPGARVVVYDVDGARVADPWSALVEAALGAPDPPSILLSAWTTPERSYYQRCPRDRLGDLLAEAARRGVGMVAAAGNWGAYSGIPAEVHEGRRVAAAPWPAGVFPAGHPGVLGVGGTMITRRSPLTEVAWSGPLPPSPIVRRALPMRRLGGSGGFSDAWPVPAWQAAALHAEGGALRTFARGPGTPAVVPYGRGYPDVALMAVGPSLHRPGWAEPTASAYQLAVTGADGRPGWIDHAGGTSVAAPIWAAILARLNQALVAAGRPRAGFVNPLLYALQAELGGDPARAPFRSIEAGRTDVEMAVVDADGQVAAHALPGYEAAPGWSPAAGLGVPRVGRLIEAALARRV